MTYASLVQAAYDAANAETDEEREMIETVVAVVVTTLFSTMCIQGKSAS